jgi:hypothetical protein
VLTNAAEDVSLAREDLVWSGLRFNAVDEEAFAREQEAVGDLVHFHHGVWWKRLKPGFCQPCFLFRGIDHRECWPQRARSPLGFMHIAAPGSPANSVYRMIGREQVQTYSLRQADKKRRNLVRAAMARLEVRPVTQLSDLTQDGYEAYVSYRERTGWGRDKSRRAVFEPWIAKAFRRPNRIVLGAYLADKLVAFMLPCAARDVAFVSFIAAHSDALWAHPNDALYHAFLCIARQTPGIQLADMGPTSSKATLDSFKLHYGQVRELPCYTWVNPAVNVLLGWHMRQRYPWLNQAA